MDKAQRKEMKARLANYEIRLRALRSTPGAISAKDDEAERYLSSEIDVMRSKLNEPDYEELAKILFRGANPRIKKIS